MTKHAWNAAEYVVPEMRDVPTVARRPLVQTLNRPSLPPEVSIHPFDELSDESSALTKDWDELAARVAASPYLRPGWVAAWWRAFGTGKLEIHALRKNQRLVAVLPVARTPDMLTAVVNPHTPQFGLLADGTDSATELAQSLFTHKPRRVSIGALDSASSSLKACWRAAEDAATDTPLTRIRFLRILTSGKPGQNSKHG